MATLRGIPFDANEIILPDGSAGYDNVLYSADFAEWLGTYFKNGILVPGGALISTQLQVTDVDASHIKIDTGNIVVNGRTAFVTEAVYMTSTASAPNVERWDRVVIELNLEENTNAFILKVVIGTESTAPEAPALVRTDEIYQMSLGTVKHNNSGIYEIIDDRAVDNLCGISQVLIGVKPPLPVTGDEASNIGYEGSSSGLSSTNVQDAIDEVVADLNEVTKTFTATIPVTGWVGDAAPFSLEIQAQGILSTDNPIVDIVSSSTYASAKQQLSAWGNIYKIITGVNKLTCYADTKPEVAIPIQIKVVR